MKVKNGKSIDAELCLILTKNTEPRILQLLGKKTPASISLTDTFPVIFIYLTIIYWVLYCIWSQDFLKFNFNVYILLQRLLKKKRLPNIKIYYDKILLKKSNENKIILGKEQHKISNCS